MTVKSTTLQDLVQAEKSAAIQDTIASVAKDVKHFARGAAGMWGNQYADPITNILDKAKLHRVADKVRPYEYSEGSAKNMNARAQAKFESIAKAHGYEKQIDPIGEIVYHNPKTGKSVSLNTFYKMRNNASMSPSIFSGNPDMVTLGDTPRFRTKGVLMHEFGHHLQSKRVLKAHELAARYSKQLAPLALTSVALASPVVGMPVAAAATKGILASTVGAGLVRAGIEAHASYLGSKHLGNRWKHRARAFHGVPSYLSEPAGTYIGAKLNLMDTLTKSRKLGRFTKVMGHLAKLK